MAEMNQAEIDRTRTGGKDYMIRRFGGYNPPQDINAVARYRSAIDQERRTVAASALSQTEKDAENQALTAAEFEINWQSGEIDATHGYFAGIDTDIGNRLKDPTYQKEKRDPKTNVKTVVWDIGGEIFNDEASARPAMAAAVLAERDKRMVDLAKEIDAKEARDKDLTPLERGQYHAARIIDDYAHPLVVCVETGATGQVKQAVDSLGAKKDDLSGLDDSEATVVLVKQATELPHPQQLAALVGDKDIKAGLDGVQTTFLGTKIVEVVNRVAQDVAGRMISSTELAGGVDLADKAREKISEAVWECAKNQVKAYELSEGNKVGGLAALRGEMRKRKLDEDLLWRPYRERNQEDQAKAIMDLDAVYRAVFESQASDFVPGVFSAGQFWAGVDPDRAKVIISTLVRPGDLRSLVIPGDFRDENEKKADLKKRNDLLTAVETNRGVQERTRVERARKMFGIDKAGRDADKYQDVAGYLNFIAWSMSRHGEYKNEKTGEKLSWVPEDPIIRIPEDPELPEDPKDNPKKPTTSTLARIKESTALWFKEYVMESVDPHLSATKKAGIDPNPIIQVVLWAELAKREGVHLDDFKSEVAKTNGSEAAIMGVANSLCKNMRSTLADALVGTIDAPGALVELVPLLTPEGRLNYMAIMERLKVRPWGEKTQWQQLADVEADLFKHLIGTTKGETMELFYQIGYETQFRNYRDSVLTSGKNIPEEIDALVSGQKFLRYRTKAEMGLDFNSSLVQSIGALLGLKGYGKKWDAYAGDKIGRYVKTVIIEGIEKIGLKGLPDDARIEILKKLGIDITRPLPEPGYKSWRNNLDSLIKNAKELGYDKYDKDKKESDKIMVALRAFNGYFDMDATKCVSPRDVVLEFKWRLARAAYDKYLGLGQTMLRKGDITIDQIWEGLKIEGDGLLSLSEFAEQFQGLWGGDILAKNLEGKLNPSFLEKARNLKEAPVEQGGAMVERTMIKIFDILHGQKIPRLKTFIPDFLEAPLNMILPADVPTAIALITNVSLGLMLGNLASHSIIAAQPIFQAFPIIDRLPILNLIPGWIKTIPLRPEISFSWFGGVLWNVFAPFPLSGLKVQAYLFNWSLEAVNSILIRNRWGRLLSEKELKKSRAPKGEK